MSGEQPRGHLHEIPAKFVLQRDPDRHLVNDRVQDVRHGRQETVLDGFGQQLLEQQDLDAPVAKELHELVVLLARLAHPEHVVEQQLASRSTA